MMLIKPHDHHCRVGRPPQRTSSACSSSSSSSPSFRRLLEFLVLVVTTCWVVEQAQARKVDRNQPHPHSGLLKSYDPGPFHQITLSASDESKLITGQPVMKQTLPDKDDPEAGGGAICVQDVMAPPDLVWNQILNLNSYKGKVPKVLTSQNYFTGRNSDGSERIKTKMVLGVLPGYSYESYYDHSYYKDRGSLTWRLDYGKTSDFDDVSGHWHVEPHPTRPQTASRVFYACDIKLHGSVPGPILNYISKAALKQATGWVKKESEKEAQAKGLGVVDGEHHHAAAATEGPPPLKKRKFAFGLGKN